jgi:hypothetical protein
MYMPTFPKSEAEVVALANAMITGYTTYGADFPSVVVADLQTALATYQTDLQSQANARAQAQLATETKSQKLEALVAVMKNDLKLSEVDVAANPTKLTEIGWGSKTPPTPMTPPNQPTNLIPVLEGPGTLTLRWDKPATGSGGTVRNYLIERSDQPAGGGIPGPWTLIASVYENEIYLTGQPRGIEMQYRVTASNAAGESLPSNIATVVL